jgi:hypothetical protein
MTRRDGASQSSSYDAALEKDDKIMVNENILRRTAHPIRPEATTHLFTVGQVVRVKSGFDRLSQSENIYRITGTLPPKGDSPQYRIRNDEERYERVTTQDNLEPMRVSPGGESATLIDRTFGQSTQAQQSRDQKPKKEKKPR